MTALTFEFRLRDAPQANTQRAFVDTLKRTGRFSRNEKSQIVFEMAPNDRILIVRKNDLQAVIEDHPHLIQITGDIGDECWQCLWFWATARKHLLPRIGGAYNPEPPRPVAHVAPQDRYVKARDA